VLCGSVQPPALAVATQTISVPWHAATGAETNSVLVRASLPACGHLQGIESQGIDSSGSANVWTITVDAVVPDVHGRCAGTRSIAQRVVLEPGGTTGAPPPLVSAASVRHGRLGPSVQALVRS
jgi:hypothetical protein